MSTVRKIGLIVAAFAAIFIVAGATLTLAQDDPDSTPTPPAGPGAEDAPQHVGPGLRNIIDPDVLKQAAADALGITVEDLEEAHSNGVRLPELAEEQGVDLADVRTAVEEARNEMIDQAIAEGLLTEEQAEWLKERPFGFGRRSHGRGPGGLGLVDPEMVEAAIADALGISVEELQAAREDGMRLPELAEEQGVDMADVEAAIQAVREEAIQQAVEDGTITEEQAERLLEGEGPCHGPGFGGRGFRGGPRGFFGPDAPEGNGTNGPAFFQGTQQG